MRFLRLCLFVLVGFCLAFPAAAQQTVERDPVALAIAQQALAAMGGGQSLLSYQDSEARGTLTIAVAASRNWPIVLKSKGTKKVRVELSKPNGTNTLIVNGGRGVLKHADRTTRRLQPYTTIGQRVSHIPVFSLLAEYWDSNVEVTYVGQAVVSGRPAEVVALSLPSGDLLPASLARAASRTLFFIDKLSGLVAKVEYDHYAENDSNAKQKVETFFSDYRNVNGVLVPFRQITHTDGRLESELVLSSVAFNVGISDSEFALSE